MPSSAVFDVLVTRQYASSMARPRRLVALIGWATLLSGCGYPLADRVQILANTIPTAASCTVSRGNQLIRHIDSTPGIDLVPTQAEDYVVRCHRNAHRDE